LTAPIDRNIEEVIVKEYIPIVAAMLGGVIVSIGWFVTGKLNRSNNIDLKRLDYRIRALESFLPVWTEIEKDGAALSRADVVEKLATARRSFHLFGAEADVQKIEALVVAVERKDLAAANKALSPIVALMKSGIRTELRINAAPFVAPV
jgi:hypothetical protein